MSNLVGVFGLSNSGVGGLSIVKSALQIHATLLQYGNDQKPPTEPEYMPLSIRSSTFVRAVFS